MVDVWSQELFKLLRKVEVKWTLREDPDHEDPFDKVKEQ